MFGKLQKLLVNVVLKRDVTKPAIMQTANYDTDDVQYYKYIL